MSYFQYMACPREMPTGLFGHEPKAVYDSYLEYKRSSDYRPPDPALAAEQERRDPGHGRKRERMQGRVAVYETAKDAQRLSVEPFSPRVDSRGAPAPGDPKKTVWKEYNRTSEQVLMRHFTLPFLYNVEGSWEMIAEYLCKYLRPGERAEVYECWAGEEALPRKKKKDSAMDLEEFTPGSPVPEQSGREGRNGFVVYLAPRAPKGDCGIMPVGQGLCAVEVVVDR